MSSGTSIAAAHVTGVLALVLQKRPDLTLQAARKLLAESARDLGSPGPDAEFGSGLVDARAALERAAEPAGAAAAQVAATGPATAP
jgi:subtilisin family serine protease